MTVRNLRIDWVAPPFAGHLFPMLRLAEGLRAAGFEDQRVHTTPCMESAVLGAGLEFCPMLAERESAILEVAAAGGSRIGLRPFALMGQFRECLGFLGELGKALDERWSWPCAEGGPDLVIADSVLPTAGLAARRAGARWWTSMASVSPTETKRGTPAYLGGWRSVDSPAYRLRDAAGRAATRGFKRAAGLLFRSRLRAMGVGAIYREDGAEACYSDDVILGLGSRAFEFERDWPAAMRLIGYPVGTAVRSKLAPPVEPGRPHLLVTLGTHLQWARKAALEHAQGLARHLGDWTIHLSHGDPAGAVLRVQGNLTEVSWVPYDESLRHYAAICHHGGAGINYAALAAGVPALVWPRDFDQFDNAARLVARGAGLRAKGEAEADAATIRQLHSDPAFKVATEELGQDVRSADPLGQLLRLLEDSF